MQGIPSSITYINNQQRTMQLLIEKKITNNGIVPASRISCAPFKSKLSFCNNWSISLLNDFSNEMSLLVSLASTKLWKIIESGKHLAKNEGKPCSTCFRNQWYYICLPKCLKRNSGPFLDLIIMDRNRKNFNSKNLIQLTEVWFDSSTSNT